MCLMHLDWFCFVCLPFCNMLNFNLLLNSQGIIFLSQFCLVLYFICFSLLHSLTMRLIVSSLSLHNLHLLLRDVLLIFVLTQLVLMALLWASIKRDNISLLRFHFCHNCLSLCDLTSLLLENICTVVFFLFLSPRLFLFIIMLPILLCCRPYIMDSPTSINTYQRERQTECTN